MDTKEYKELRSSMETGFAHAKSEREELRKSMEIGFASSKSEVDELRNSMNTGFGDVKMKIFEVEGRITAIEEKMADKNDINKILKAVDAYAHKADKYFQEHKILSGQFKRHEGWLKKIAVKTDTKLDY